MSSHVHLIWQIAAWPEKKNVQWDFLNLYYMVR